ncbi:hypothetical protein [Tuberibacillus sp. Marseille-P3662]|uniref:hypothetical protein n=1 Tax=Tuberibacillus sp. Marseille-P3662 TaxID=1965358 RepID=UPI000A1CE91A|nr:hypothetical protein [Tuberibacillus sp. Marseille-P3662]
MDTNKQSYYVKVGTGEVLPDKTISEWEFEIKASDEEVLQLQTIFEQTDTGAWEDYWRAHHPIEGVPKGSSDDYDYYLKRIYEMLHELGTDETRHHIEAMGIIDRKQ